MEGDQRAANPSADLRKLRDIKGWWEQSLSATTTMLGQVLPDTVL